MLWPPASLFLADMVSLHCFWQASLGQGWDVICPEEYSLSRSLQQKLGLMHPTRPGNRPSFPQFGTLVHFGRGDKLQSKDEVCKGFKLLLSVGRLALSSCCQSAPFLPTANLRSAA